MTPSTWAAVGILLSGIAFVAFGVFTRRRRDAQQFAAIMGSSGQPELSKDSEEFSTLVEGTVGFAGMVVNQVDTRGILVRDLDAARVPLRAGEFAIIVASATFAAAVFGMMLTGQWVVAVALIIAGPFVARAVLQYRAAARIKKFASQFPDALTVLAASLSAGHTFLRAIQMMAEEADAPLAEEFSRVVSETQLGMPLVDAMERMAQRIPLRDVEWTVQAVRIQQSVGGRLADLLATLADFIRSREEVRREIAALTAEGRISAWVVGGIPVALFLIVSVTQPDYMQPLLQGWGLLVLGLTALSVVVGMMLIRRMVNSVEV